MDILSISSGWWFQPTLYMVSMVQYGLIQDPNYGYIGYRYTVYIGYVDTGSMIYP